MRTIEEIKTEIGWIEAHLPEGYINTDLCELQHELLHAITDGISLSDLETLCSAYKDGRCVILPYPIGTKVYYAETDGVLNGMVLEIVVCGYSTSAWQGRINVGKDSQFIICHNSYNEPSAYQLCNVYPTRAEAEEALKEMKE